MKISACLAFAITTTAAVASVARAGEETQGEDRWR